MRMLSLTVAASGLAFLTGCKSAQMKTTPFYEGHDVVYTGKPEDRVNLWPFAYWREPVGSVLWPMLSFSDDHFAFRPLYSRYGTESNFLWPLGKYDSKTGDGRLFPLAWGDDYFDVLPVLWNHGDRHMLFPLAYYNENSYLAVFPILWWNIAEDDVMLFPVFRHSKKKDWLFPLYYHDEDFTFVTPLAGVDRRYDSWWIMPLVYWDNDEVATPLWWQTFDGTTGGPKSWMLPPLLTGGGVNKSGASYFFSPLGGYNDKENGMFPLWYKNPNGFYTLPYCRSEDRGRVTTFVPPLMSWYESSKDGSSKTRLLMGTYGHDVEASGSTSQDWLFPLYSYDGDFKTLLFGRKTGAQSADYWWLTPLVGTTTGETTGLWVAPLVSWSSDSKVARLEKMMDSSRLDASIVGKMRKSVKRDKNGSRTNEVFMVENQRGGEKLQFGLGMVGCKRTIHLDGGQNDAHCGLWQGSSVKKKAGKRWCQGEKKTVSFYEKAEFGFRLLFGGERQRVVNFDYDTKKKVFDGEVDESDSLYGLLWSSRKEKFGGRSDAKQSLFWRLYHRDEKDGNATTDIFPFITYDERKDGYTKTSFLWRFFRYEDDPKTGTSLDLFFIPFKRP